MIEAVLDARLRPSDVEDGESRPRERLLEAALRVFANKGIHAATIREITEAVGANVAAVNYYFGSKDGLVGAVFDRFVRPIVRARNAALDELETAGASVTTREVAQCLVEPMVRLSADRWGGRSVILLLLQMRSLPTPQMQRIAADLFDAISHRFVAAFRRADPELAADAAYWRYNFALGAIMQVLTDANPVTRRLERLSGGICRAHEPTIVSQLVDFICAGMACAAGAPHPATRRAPHRRPR